MFERQKKMERQTMHKELLLLYKVFPQTTYEKKDGQKTIKNRFTEVQIDKK